MAAILVPFRGAEGKRRLAPATPQARIALGLAMLADVLSACVAVAPADVTVVANVGDDLELFGLHVSPDLDSVLYALSGRNDEERGWGRAGETWHALETVGELGGETWFQLGDRDIGLHLVRTEALRRGEPLSAVTAPPGPAPRGGGAHPSPPPQP